MPVAKTYEITKDFDFSPRANVVQTFKAGEKRSDLTRDCIKHGVKLKALTTSKDDN